MEITQRRTHCQICARAIKANTGVIANHGYTRPGNGYQSASCIGARHASYEASRDFIPEAIKLYTTWMEFQVNHAAELMGNPPKTLTIYAMHSFQEDEVFERPADFNAEENLAKSTFGYGEGYQRQHRNVVRQARQNAEHLRGDIKFLQNRYDNWKVEA